jgi:hypothetical protein
MISQKKKIDNYTVFLDKKIGEGSFGKVFIGEQDKTGLKVAVKMLDKKASYDCLMQSIRMITLRMHCWPKLAS